MSGEFVSGGTAVAAFVIALFFVRYWRQTRDPLFFMFAGGFLTFAASRLILAFFDEDDEGRIFIYGLRLVAFTLILVAIVQKNRTPAGQSDATARDGYDTQAVSQLSTRH